ncbi:alpha-1B adrenergic receptor [Protopterus annectens]|uniref:alpha-1B adrenergic receptor n=1 Tax=Protopterus annectens TaxID=7888 RepID=UPI001CFC31AC|nr:alpha-1B adrenergic receptor [Protopterus annectens]
MIFKMDTGFNGDQSVTNDYSAFSHLLHSDVATNISNQTSKNETLSELDPARAITLGLVLGIFIVFAIAGNIVVILSVACNRHLRTPTNYFIINLAIADLLLSFTVVPFSATFEIEGYWVFGRIFCDIWAAMDVLCCTASIMSLCAISIDRYIGVKYSLQYPALVTKRKAVLALLVVWVLSIVISIGPLLGWKEPAPPDEKECRITEEPFYALFSSLGSFYIPLTVVLVMYCRVYFVAKRTTKNLQAGVMRERTRTKELTLRIHYRGSQEETEGHGSKSRGHPLRTALSVKLLKFSRQKKAAKTLGIVVGMFILCWLPFFIALPIGSLFSYLRPPETVFKFVFWLGYFNSCMNPIIYPCSSKEFKRAFTRILKCQYHQRRHHRWRVNRNKNWNRGSLDNSRKDSMEDSDFINSSQKTIPSAAPSPSCTKKKIPNLEVYNSDNFKPQSPFQGEPLDTVQSQEILQKCAFHFVDMYTVQADDKPDSSTQESRTKPGAMNGGIHVTEPTNF